MKIKKITINGTEENCVEINLILGANNTGKSTFIRELENATVNGDIPVQNKWIESVTVQLDGVKSKFDALFPNVTVFSSFQDANNEIGRQGGSSIFGNNSWGGESFEALKSKGDTSQTYNIVPQMPRDRDWHYCVFASSLSLIAENCVSRLSGPFSTQIQRVDEPYKDIVHYFYSQRMIFNKIVAHIKDVFGIELIFDDLQQGQKDVRILPSITIPTTFPTPKEQADFWQKNSPTLESQGDGLKAYLKIIYALFNPAKDVIIIDEPEAFLHSPQRRSLGKFIAENATNGKQIFISTHDSEFLRGVITNTARATQIIHLKNKPRTRSYNISQVSIPRRSQSNNELILNSYFNKLTILCEAEDDRMVYQYASQVFFPAESVDVYFLGFSGKKEVITIYKDLNRLQIDVAVIFDIDVLYSGECLRLTLEEAEDSLLRDVQTSLNELSQTDRDIFKTTGSTTNPILDEKVKKSIQTMKKYKIYISPIGELESWIDTPVASKRTVQVLRNEIDISPLPTKKQKMQNFIKEAIVI